MGDGLGDARFEVVEDAVVGLVGGEFVRVAGGELGEEPVAEGGGAEGDGPAGVWKQGEGAVLLGSEETERGGEGQQLGDEGWHTSFELVALRTGKSRIWNSGAGMRRIGRTE